MLAFMDEGNNKKQKKTSISIVTFIMNDSFRRHSCVIEFDTR